MQNDQVRDYVRQLDAVQAEILSELEGLEQHELKYATDHWRWNTLRRVLLRFGDHVREHTTQLVAARKDIGAAQTMPQRMLAQAQASYGGLLGALVGLEDASLDLVPEPGEWTPRQTVEHIITIQGDYLEMIRRAREKQEPVESD